MAFDFEKFNSIVDLDGLKEDIEKQKSNTGEYEEVPYGEYEAKVVKMELKESKNGDPMVSIWFSICGGDYANRYIFYNKVLLVNKPSTFHFLHEFLRDMEVDTPIEFIEWRQYNDMIESIFKEIEDKKSFHIEYKASKNPKFSEIVIKEAFVL